MWGGWVGRVWDWAARGWVGGSLASLSCCYHRMSSTYQLKLILFAPACCVLADCVLTAESLLEKRVEQLQVATLFRAPPLMASSRI